MQRFRDVFKQTKCSVIGMIHLGALPGTPMYQGNLSKILDAACTEAELYESCCIDGVLIENMHDVPYIQPKNMEPETVAVMSAICSEIRKIVPPSKPCGVQVLAGGNKEAVAVALAANLQFVRVEGFVFSHIADEGFIDASAGNLLRYRRKIGAENVLVLTDVKKKHSSHSITADISLVETIKAAEFFLSDGIILTGTETGDPVNISHFSEAKQISQGPVLIGSGVTISNVQNYIQSDALIIGSYFKENGSWKNRVDKSRVLSFMEKINNIRLSVN